MKKTLKELLWFVIPLVLIVATIVTLYAIADSQINTPKWIGLWEYFLLFSKSPGFAKAVFNTVAYYGIPAVLIAIVLFVVQLFAKMKRPLYYGIMMTATTLSTLCFKVFYLNLMLFGYPNTTYPADTIIAKPEEFTLSILDMLKSISLLDVLQSMLIGIVVCCLFWLVEQATKAIRKRIAK